MKFHSIVKLGCMVASVFLLLLAYGLAGYWWAALLLASMGILSIVLKRWSLFWSATTFLLLCVVLAAVGVRVNLSLWLLSLACTAALAYWDLTLFGEGIISAHDGARSLQVGIFHLKSLAAAVCLGLILIFVSSAVLIQLPFLVVILLVLLAVGGLSYSLTLQK